MKPFVSVVIPCRNEARFLPRCLDSILSGDYPADRMEVLAVDGSSSDATRECIRAYAQRDGRVRLVENPQATTPAALNRGIDAARGEVIARVDAHAAVAPDYFTRCVEHLSSSGADNVGGVMRTLPRDCGWFAGPIAAALSHPFGVGNSYFRIGSGEPRWVDTVFGGCWRRQVFERVGRFNPELLRSQDLEFSLRLRAAGGRTLLAPDVRSDYYARARLGSFWRHNFLNGEWAILPFVYSQVIPVSLRHLIPLLFVLALGAGAALLPWSRWPLAAVLVPYAAANLGASARVAVTRHRVGYLALMPAVFGALHLSYGLGSVSGLARAAGVLWKRGAHGLKPRPKEKTCQPQP
jgi:glycosyltransferase involved in cell wall biosynthesis